MSIIEDFKNGRITRSELLERSESDPALKSEVAAMLGEPMSEDELQRIAAAGTRGTSGDDEMHGTHGNDAMYGLGGDDVMFGGDGNDTLVGGGGSDVMYGGSGNDALDGGGNDDASDVVYGGSGDDSFAWAPSGDGSDHFDGGSGNDTIKVDLYSLYGAGHPSLEQAVAEGMLTISLFTEDGDPIEITDAMWQDGKLTLPEGCNGTITGTTGETLTFNDVETITVW